MKVVASDLGRFKREALANSSFHHPSALEMDDAGVTSAGQHFLAMEFFDGSDLPHPNAYTLLPEEGLVWIGTRRGVATFPMFDAAGAFTGENPTCCSEGDTCQQLAILSAASVPPSIMRRLRRPSPRNKRAAACRARRRATGSARRPGGR